MGLAWELQAKETNVAYAAFCTYLNLGPERSLEKAREELKRKPGYISTLKDWSVRHEWVKRAEAYDQHVSNQTRAALEKELIRAQSLVIKNALSDYYAIRGGIDIALGVFEGALWQVGVTDMRELLRLMREADDLGRRATGLPDRVAEINSNATPKDWRQAVLEALEDGLGNDINAEI